MLFKDLFHQATGQPPFPFQERLVFAEELPAALCAPTGAGKTAAVVLAWLYRRRYATPAVQAQTPRRLVFCLPMRVLVTQTVMVVERWLRQLKLTSSLRVVSLLGGEDDGQWFVGPEEDAILIGTQDMLLSRALGRGYGARRYLWPWLYGLLSNDCLWALDEVQLMGPGLATALQLHALRQRLGTLGPGHSIFMSATLELAWLRTVDHATPAVGQLLRPGPDDLEALKERRTAAKRLRRAEFIAPKSDKEVEGGVGKLAQEVLAAHRVGSRTLVVMNTVRRALALYNALVKAAPTVSVHLLHSRFRPQDRARLLEGALADGDSILVSTQVVEAGVDLSARVLFTELCPWASLVQRAGRCNRRGEFPASDPGHVWWIDQQELSDASAAPYTVAELTQARAELCKLEQFNPATIEDAGVRLDPPRFKHVLRAKDLWSLFDTTAEVGGADIDVSRYIREDDDRDVQVAWRSWPDAQAVPLERRRLGRDELCPVPLTALHEWMNKHPAVYAWDPLAQPAGKEARQQGGWVKVLRAKLVPGTSYLLRAEDGGYDERRGFSPESTQKVAEVPPPAAKREKAAADGAEEANDDDELSHIGAWVSLAQHASDTAAAADAALAGLPFLDARLQRVVRTAARAHDLGKAHAVFQETMKRELPGALSRDELWAKSGTKARHLRRGFRHELASALAWLQAGPEEDRDLIAYLLAAHHGKVRLSLRALPNDAAPAQARRHARGVWEGDPLPALALGEGVTLPALQLSLAPMLLGEDEGRALSWSARVQGLLRELGPFRLAYLEALVRSADWRASMLWAPAEVQP